MAGLTGNNDIFYSGNDLFVDSDKIYTDNFNLSLSDYFYDPALLLAASVCEGLREMIIDSDISAINNPEKQQKKNIQNTCNNMDDKLLCDTSSTMDSMNSMNLIDPTNYYQHMQNEKKLFYPFTNKK
jgi:hypothetical protein